jgi:hypothetical protein
MPETYACPDEPLVEPMSTNYLVVVGPGRLFTGERKGTKLAEVSAGTSNTLMVAESDRSVPWTAPEEIRVDPTVPGPELGSQHPGGHHVAMADGWVRFEGPGLNGKTGGRARTRNSIVQAGQAANTPVVPPGQK